MLVAILLALALLAGCDALDQTDQKRGSTRALPSPNVSPSSSPADGSVNPTPLPTASGSPSAVQTISNGSSISGCSVANFNANLNGDVVKEIAVPLLGPVRVTGKGALGVELNTKALKLNLSITELSVSQPITQGFVEAELNKAVGERNLFLLDKLALDKLREKGDPWKKHACDVGMVGTYKFPYGPGTMVTVAFEPALPFAAYPETASSENFSTAVGSGLSFTGIVGKVTEITGNKPPEISVGDTASGQVTIAKAGSAYKFSYEFGAASSLVKFGLFNTATYSYTSNGIKQVELTSPVQQGQDSITILFK